MEEIINEINLIKEQLKQKADIEKPIKEEIIKLHPEAYLPTRANEDDACKDLYALYTVRKMINEEGKEIDTECRDMVVMPHSNLLIKTGIAIAWDNPDYYIQLWTRSGLAYKNKIITMAGVIDYGYRKDIGVVLYNGSDEPFHVKPGDRIAQYNYNRISINLETSVVDEFTIPRISNRDGGFGSTGK